MKVILTTITRSPRGNPMRSTRLLEADQIRVGRGAECELRLADPRVPLHTRTIILGRNAPQMYDAVDLNAEATGVYRSQTLTPGTSFKIGPFQLEVLEPGPDADFSITVELVQPLPGKSSLSAKDIYEQARRAPVSKRTASWVLFGIIITLFLLLPVLSFVQYQLPEANSRQETQLDQAKRKMTLGADAAWSPGQIAIGHQPFANDCKLCHSKSFTRVQDADCRACHQTLADHVSPQMAAGTGLDEVRCASCHRDHTGTLGLKQQISHYYMAECGACHADIKKRLPDTLTGNVSDFATDHPEFRISFLAGARDAHGKAAISRSSLTNKAKLTEKRGLKFPHNVHLDPRGVRSPQGLVKTDCATCHVPDGSGVRFKPVTMKDNCQSCHELRFEVAAPERQVPHGNVDDVISTMRDYYSYLAINGIVLNRATGMADDSNAPRGIPGKSGAAELRLSSNSDVQRQVQLSAQEIFEKTTCFSCHEVTRQESAGGKTSWSIAPVSQAPLWLPKAKFTHSKHEMLSCNGCHAASTSKSAGDILIPDVESCRSCHAGNKPEPRKIVSNCGLCHGFHEVSHEAMPANHGLWPSARDAALLQASPAPGKAP